MSSYQQRSRSVVVSTAPTERMNVTSAIILAASVIPLLALLIFVRTPLVLPSLSIVALASAGVISLTAWWMKADRDRPGISLWDVSGAYAFVGFAVGMLSDPQQVVEFWLAPEASR